MKENIMILAVQSARPPCPLNSFPQIPLPKSQSIRQFHPSALLWRLRPHYSLLPQRRCFTLEP